MQAASPTPKAGKAFVVYICMLCVLCAVVWQHNSTKHAHAHKRTKEQQASEKSLEQRGSLFDLAISHLPRRYHTTPSQTKVLLIGPHDVNLRRQLCRTKVLLTKFRATLLNYAWFISGARFCFFCYRQQQLHSTTAR